MTSPPKARCQAAVPPSMCSPAAAATRYALRLIDGAAALPERGDRSVEQSRAPLGRRRGMADCGACQFRALVGRQGNGHPQQDQATRKRVRGCPVSFPSHSHSISAANGEARHCTIRAVRRVPSRGSAANSPRSPIPKPTAPLSRKTGNAAPRRPPPKDQRPGAKQKRGDPQARESWRQKPPPAASCVGR